MSIFRFAQPGYPEEDVKPMREELEAVGAVSLRSVEDVEKHLQDHKGTALLVVNSVCGCAAGGARPGVSAALQNKTIPDAIFTVFAGVDREATARARDLITEYPPSSPSIALFKDGKVVYMMERLQIEGKMPEQIAEELANAFDTHCEKDGPSIPPEQFQNLRFVQVCGSALAAKARQRLQG
ncbi:MAG: BrxA/BrxB family bacilliredoxin [Candidatus Sumerlaeia bacterium]|nr:BrxA/BrxB family bacilliredoxin [Candidatus Sumerlaeia bacterium]